MSGVYAADGSLNTTVVGGNINLDASGLTVDSQGISTAAQPTYTEGSTNAALSMDLKGQLRVRDDTVNTSLGTLNTNLVASEIAVGTAGSASADVLSVQGIASMTPLAVSQSGDWEIAIDEALPAGTNVIGHVIVDTAPTTAVTGTFFQATQPVSGTVTANPTAFSYNNITTSTTTTVKSGAGTLHTIVVNTDGTVASSVTVYDNTTATGTKIATINSLSSTQTYLYDVAFSTGLTLVTTGTAPSDITVTYR